MKAANHYLSWMKSLTDLLIEEKALVRHIKAKEKRLEKVRDLIAKATPDQQAEAKAVDVIKALLKEKDMVYGELFLAAHQNKIGGSNLKRLLNKYKGRYWNNTRVGNRWVWSVGGGRNRAVK